MSREGLLRGQMAENDGFIIGEFPRTLDERYRIQVPGEIITALVNEDAQNHCILAKERPGALSLWNAEQWKERLDKDVQLVKSKIQAGRLEGRIEQVQLLGRLLSTRHEHVDLAESGRLLIPKRFREFLGVEPGSQVLIIGAAVCLEIWSPDAWVDYLGATIPEFRKLLDELAD